MTDDPRKKLTPEEEQFLVREIRNHVITRVCDYGLYDLRLIKAAMVQIDGPAGSNDPLGEFFQQILSDLVHGHALTPAAIQDELGKFAVSFGAMVVDTHRFLEFYPESLEGEE